MHYVIVPNELCERRNVFTKNPRTNDGRVVISLRDLGLISFSLGTVDVLNEKDMALLMKTETGSREPAADTEEPENTEET